MLQSPGTGELRYGEENKMSKNRQGMGWLKLTTSTLEAASKPNPDHEKLFVI